MNGDTKNNPADKLIAPYNASDVITKKAPWFKYGDPDSWKTSWGSKIADFMTPKSIPEALMYTVGGGAAMYGISKLAPILKSLVPNVSSLVSKLDKGNKWMSTPQREAALKKGADWSREWLKHPATQEKLKNLNIAPEVNIGVSRGSYKTTIPTAKQYTFNYKDKDLSRGWSLESGGSGMSVTKDSGFGRTPKRYIEQPVNYINPITSRGMSPGRITSTGIHEGGVHGIYPKWMYRTSGTKVGDVKWGVQDTELGEIFRKGVVRVIPKGMTTGRYNYLADPWEMHARTVQIKHQLRLDPEFKMSDNQAKSVLDYIKRGSSYVDADWASMFKDAKAFKKMMNAAPAAAAVVGGAQLNQGFDFSKNK